LFIFGATITEYASKWLPSNPVVIWGVQIAIAALFIAIIGAVEEVIGGVILLALTGPVWLASRQFLINWFQDVFNVVVSEVVVGIITVIIVVAIALIYLHLKHVKLFQRIAICLSLALLEVVYIQFFIILGLSGYKTTEFCCPSSDPDTCPLDFSFGYLVLFLILFLLRFLAMRALDRKRLNDKVYALLEERRLEEGKLKAKKHKTKSISTKQMKNNKKAKLDQKELKHLIDKHKCRSTSSKL